jgi:hypothetical protein
MRNVTKSFELATEIMRESISPVLTNTFNNVRDRGTTERHFGNVGTPGSNAIH